MKMAVVPKPIYIFNAIPIKIPMLLFTDTENSILKFIWKHERAHLAKEILSTKSNAGGILILDL
jgi:hypothetical protein